MEPSGIAIYITLLLKINNRDEKITHVFFILDLQPSLNKSSLSSRV